MPPQMEEKGDPGGHPLGFSISISMQAPEQRDLCLDFAKQIIHSIVGPPQNQSKDGEMAFFCLCKLLLLFVKVPPLWEACSWMPSLLIIMGLRVWMSPAWETSLGFFLVSDIPGTSSVPHPPMPQSLACTPGLRKSSGWELFCQQVLVQSLEVEQRA